MYTAQDIETLRRYRDAGLGAWTTMPEADRDVYRSIHHKLDALGKATENETLRYTLTSGFNLQSGVRGNRPKDLWCALSHRDSANNMGMPQIYIIVSDRGVELGFAAAIHRGDFSNPGLRQRLAELAPKIFDAIPEYDSEAMQSLQHLLLSSHDWRFRKKNRLPADDPDDFSSLEKFLTHLKSESGKNFGAGVIAKVWSAQNLLGVDIDSEFKHAATIFQPIIIGTQQNFGADNKIQRTPKYWIEKTIVAGRADRMDGDHSLGRALWSPQKASNGNQIYQQMLEVRPGDAVLHLVDNSQFSGISLVHSEADDSFIGLAGTDWAGRPAYRVELREYVAISPPLTREEFFEQPGPGDELQALHANHTGLFYTHGLALNQGAYLTEAPEELVRVLNDIHRRKTGKALPHISMTSSPIVDFNKSRLNAAIKLFYWIFGAEGFKSPRYIKEERSYKDEIAARWQSVLEQYLLSSGGQHENPEEALQAITGVLVGPPSNLLPWRYHDVFKKAKSQDEARLLINAIQSLINSAKNGMRANIDAFQIDVMPLYEKYLNETGVKPASHCIPSLILWLTFPNEHFYVRPSLYNSVSRILTGSAPNEWGAIMSSEYYTRAQEFFVRLRDHLEHLNPKDMIDVQGFAWGIFNYSKIWFGGKTYAGTDMLPEFRQRGIFGVGYGRSEGMHTLIQSITEHPSKSDRDRIKSEVSQLAGTDGERTALLEFLDLLYEPGLLLVKSTFAQSGMSKIKLFGLCRTSSDYEFEPNLLGHTVKVDWLSNLDETYSLGTFFPKVNKTLSHIDLEDALDIIAGDQMVQSSPNEPLTLDWLVEKTLWPKEALQTLIDALLTSKGQVVLAGPPGTGKTWVAKHIAQYLTQNDEDRFRTVQFHPSYGYEEFMEGIRPIAEGGAISFEPRRGIVLDVVDKMGTSDDPFVLIIDEMNRANLPRVFGELMYLMEYRSEEIQLQYSPAFSLPRNLFFIGTMNTADRSIRSIDAALRRRFEIFECLPSRPVLENYYSEHKNEVKNLFDGFDLLNTELLGNLGKHHTIGHTFFMQDNMTRDRLRGIWERQILPLIEEYFFDQSAILENFTFDAFWPTVP
jgi:hypothetical protein